MFGSGRVDHDQDVGKLHGGWSLLDLLQMVLGLLRQHHGWIRVTAEYSSRCALEVRHGAHLGPEIPVLASWSGLTEPTTLRPYQPPRRDAGVMTSLPVEPPVPPATHRSTLL